MTCASFNKDSTYVASGDMSGLLKVWKVDSGQEIWSFEVGDLEVVFHLINLLWYILILILYTTYC